MTTITDNTPSATPTQIVAAKLMLSAGPAEARPDDTATLPGETYDVRLYGEDLSVEEGRLTGGIVKRIEIRDPSFEFLRPEIDADADAAAPIVAPVVVSEIDGLNLDAQKLQSLIDGDEGEALVEALMAGDLIYFDSLFGNVALGDDDDDLFFDRGGSDVYDGAGGTDGVSYENSNLSPIIPPILLGAPDDAIAPPPFPDFPLLVADLRRDKAVVYLSPMPWDLSGKVDLNEGFAFESDALISIENVEGSRNGDILIGDGRANLIEGGFGDDQLFGGNGWDTLRGGADDDKLRAGRGDDALYGGLGDDRLKGGAGDDRIESGDGFDRMTGDEGADTFVFTLTEDGRNIITDFNAAEDTISLDLLGFDLDIRQQGDNVVIRHTDDIPPFYPGEEPPEPSSIRILVLNTKVEELVEGENLEINYAQY